MIKNLVFSGGVLKGWAYIGTIRALEEYSIFSEIDNVAGTSVGAVFGLFYILKIPWSYILEKIMELKFFSLIDIQLNTIISRQCLIKGEKFKKFILSILKDYLNSPEKCTFRDLQNYTNINFTVTALNLTKGDVEYFNAENTPGIYIIDALIASCSLPLLFPSYKINEYYYCDGALCNNFPTNLFDDTYTIGFNLFNDSISNKGNSFFDILNTLVDLANKSNKQERKNVFNILDSQYDTHTYNIKQTPDDIFSIYMNGYINSRRIIFDNFIALGF